MTRPITIAERPAAVRRAAPLPYALRRIFDPALYQGGGVRDGYFEGWYFKLVDRAGHHPLAIIPGVSHDASGGTSHSFVQVVRPGGHTIYLEFPVAGFRFSRERFEIAVGENRFSSAGIKLAIERDGLSLNGSIAHSQWRPWPVTLRSPGIMGWYRYVPRMECYHGVVSLDHGLSGTLVLDGQTLSFDGGRGYAEKDWGGSFPSSWVWAQSNHFERGGVSVTASVARIPWRGSSFIGFIAGVLLDGSLYRFATYTGARLTAFESWSGGAHFTLQDRDHRLDLTVDGALPAALKAPQHGRMVARADESLGATVEVTLTRRTDGAVLFEGVGQYAGVEVMDAAGELAAGVRS